MTKSINGCSYGKVTRNMVENMTEEFKEFKNEIRKEFSELRKTNVELYNHLSERLPKWAVAIGGLGMMLLGTLMGALIGGSIK